VIATPDSDITYIVRMDESNCTVFDTISLRVLPNPLADFVFETSNGCGELTVQFINRSEDETQLVWDFGDGSPVVNSENPVHTYTTPGTYVVSLRAENPSGCERVATANTPIVVDFPGSADYTASVETGQPVYLPTAVVFFTSEAINAVSHFWNFGDGTTSTQENPQHEYLFPGQYTVTHLTTDPNGCSYTSRTVVVSVVAPSTTVSNVFTPNGDGSNDRWAPRVVAEPGTEVYVQVVDRWGNEVFQVNNLNESWNGLLPNGQDAPEGVYFYVVKVDERETRGNLTLIR
jgi:gliding motility-associated-like protein